MRFIIREQEHEEPRSAGLLRYWLYGALTGAVEEWRLTAAPGDHKFLRVDLDARSAESGDSYLYHLALDPAGKPMRLKFLFFNAETHISGDLQFDGHSALLSREMNGRRLEEEQHLHDEWGFWFPSTVALGYLAAAAGGGNHVRAITLERESGFGLRAVTAHLEWQSTEEMDVARQALRVRPCSIRWNDRSRKVWLDDDGWPVKMLRPDGLEAVESRRIRYKAREN
jgi:hypothetical protein